MDARSCCRRSNIMLAAGRAKQEPKAFCDNALRQIKSWSLNIAIAFGRGRTVGVTPGPDAEKIFETQFMTVSCFGTILGKTKDWLQKLKAVIEIVDPENRTVRLMDLTNGQSTPQWWREACRDGYEKILRSGQDETGVKLTKSYAQLLLPELSLPRRVEILLDIVDLAELEHTFANQKWEESDDPKVGKYAHKGPHYRCNEILDYLVPQLRTLRGIVEVAAADKSLRVEFFGEEGTSSKKLSGYTRVQSMIEKIRSFVEGSWPYLAEANAPYGRTPGLRLTQANQDLLKIYQILYGVKQALCSPMEVDALEPGDGQAPFSGTEEQPSKPRKGQEPSSGAGSRKEGRNTTSTTGPPLPQELR